jgi:hypothetical protein
MKTIAMLCAFCLLLAGLASAQKKSQYACAEAKPETLCTPQNTCGSATQTCVIDIRKTGNAASVQASTPDKEKNKVFCIKEGTRVQFTSSSKNTGFVVDFGPKFPFEPMDESIIGGSNKPVEVTATAPGCYNFSAGACVSGATYGMCGNANAEAVIVP